MKTYNLILNSNNYLSKTTNNEVIYGVSWDFLPNKPLKANFNFHSEDIGNLDGDDITQLSIDWGNMVNTFTTPSGNTSYQKSNILGTLHPQQVSGTGGAKNILQTDFLDNPSVFFESKPSNTQLTVSLLDLTGALRTFNFSGNYILIIHFEEVN